MKDFGLKLLDLLERSVILQAFITIGVLSIGGYIWVIGREMPADLEKLVFIVLSFWMGSKVQHTVDANRTLRLNTPKDQK